MLKRRRLLQWIVSLPAWVPFGPATAAKPAGGERHAASLQALAEVVLPREIGTDGRARAVAAFTSWLADYRAGAELDHGYGVTQLRHATASPAEGYAAQFRDLDRRAGGTFASASHAARERAVADAVLATQLKALPALPDGGHVATDLMAHFCNGPGGNDLAYGRRIDRFGCRGLSGAEQPPPPLPGAGSTPS